MDSQNGRLAALPSKKLAGLDHLRALAITLVFVYHYRIFAHPEWVDHIGEFGWTGVDLFFVLSGFLISGQLFENIKSGKGLALKDFYIKRFFRIIPAYLLILCLYFTIPGFKEKPGLPPLWKFLTFTQNLGLDLRATRAFSHAWSLCIEEQFYLLLPFTLLALMRMKILRYGGYLLLALIVGGLLSRWVCFDHFVDPVSEDPGMYAIWYKFIYYPTYARLEGLLTGVSIAAVFAFRPTLKDFLIRQHNWLLLAGAGILTAAYFIVEDQASLTATLVGFLLVSLGYGALVTAAISPSNFLFRWSSKITAWLATLSYAIYLSHKAVIHLTQEWLSAYTDASGTIMFVASAVTSIAAGLILHFFIEKPFLHLRSQVLKKGPMSQQTHPDVNAPANV